MNVPEPPELHPKAPKPRAVSWRGGPQLDAQTEWEYWAEKFDE